MLTHFIIRPPPRPPNLAAVPSPRPLNGRKSILLIRRNKLFQMIVFADGKRIRLVPCFGTPRIVDDIH